MRSTDYPFAGGSNALVSSQNHQLTNEKTLQVTVRKAAMPSLSCLTVLLIVLAVTVSAAEGPTGVRIASEYWTTRQGTMVRVLVMKPPNPRAGVILLPGGHGNINLDSQGQIGWGVDDFLIRTRANYAQAGFVVIVPDIAVDRKPPVKLGDYRRSELQAYDLRSISGRMRRMVETVSVVAYDRGVISALNMATRGKMDLVSSLVLISPNLESLQPNDAVLTDGARVALARIPVLMISHASDECSASATNDLYGIASMITARDFRAVSVTGGSERFRLQDPFGHYGDPCSKKAPHVMSGLEVRVSSIVIEWLENQALSNRSDVPVTLPGR